ncbi:hypothetical protein Msi02_06070 [Microbispora siamensis]|uniref:Uncharacterized protein n=1 Tax=Microbispora siamensis TaxID=564413 RepID=A0ABQ4GED3_9ACTN|nr:hypothetical protein Msi02_06070 [Microbispora siamensis]
MRAAVKTRSYQHEGDVNDIVPAAGEYLEETLAAASPDLLRTMIQDVPQSGMAVGDHQFHSGEAAGDGPRRKAGQPAPSSAEGDVRAEDLAVVIPRIR